MSQYLFNHKDFRSLAGNLLGRLLLCALILAAIATGTGTGTAEANMRGLLAWSYRDFVASEDGKTVAEMNQFTQKYSVYWDKTGLLKGGRAGHYNIGLGYEWLSSQNELNGFDGDVSAGKLLYSGEITIAPGALPFRLHAYSGDKQPSAFSEYALTNTILDPKFDLRPSSGQSRHSGLTLMVGIRNGNYLGKFREVLSKYPRFFVDFKETYVDDSTGLDQQHYVLRDLAFVSLNKKDNWFHYRYKQFKDYNDKENNYERKAYILGTIDHTLKRQWINMSNWIKLSVDGSLTEEHDQSETPGRQNTTLYAVNLFSRMSYNRSRISNFYNFARSASDVELTKAYELPVYADGQINPDLAWRSMFINFSKQTTDLTTAAGESDDLDEGTYASGQLEMARRAKMPLTAKLDVENRKTESSNGSALRLRLETFRPLRYQRKSSYALSYSISYQQGENNADDVNYVEQLLSGRYEQQLSARHKLIADQSFVYGSGDAKTSLMAYINVEGASGLRFSDEDLDNKNGSIFRSTSSLSLESSLSARLRNTFNGYLEWVENDTEQIWQASLEQKLQYTRSGLNFNMKNYFLTGDDLNSVNTFSLTNAGLPGGQSVETANYILGHESRLTYKPNLHFENILLLEFSWNNSDNNNTYGTGLYQRSQYSFYKAGGERRQLATLYNEAEYELIKSDYGKRYYFRLLLGGTYSPYRIVRLGADFEYEGYGPDDLNTYKVSTRVGLVFPKLECEARYSYGLGENVQIFAGDRKEHLIEAEVRKMF